MQGRLLVAGLWAGVFEYIRLQGEEKPKRKYIKEPLATPLGDSSPTDFRWLGALPGKDKKRDCQPCVSAKQAVFGFLSSPPPSSLSDLFQGVNAGGCFSAHTIQTSLEQFCNLLPLNGEAIINLTIPMIVSEKPGLKFTPTFDYLEKICQPVRGVISIQFLLDAGGGAVGQDIVHLPVDSLQIDGCLFILLV